MDKSTQARPLEIVVAQTHQYNINLISGMIISERIKRPGNYNNVMLTTEPSKVIKRAFEGKADIVVTGQHFYNPPVNTTDDLLKSMSYLSLPDKMLNYDYIANIKSIGCGNHLTNILKEINPSIMVFRYSTNPSEDNTNIVGDIPKTMRVQEISDFLNSQILNYYFMTRDSQILKERFPEIKFHDKNLGIRDYRNN